MAQRQALGRGLEALIPGAGTQERGIRQVPLDAIRPSSHQPRKLFDDGKLKELAASIRSHGVLAPVILRQTEEGYELVAGERRFRAARMAGIASIPAIIREVSNSEMLELALIENIQREDLNPIEEASAYRRLAAEFKLTQEQIADAVGKDRSSVANYVRLLRLPEEIRAEIASGSLSMGHARALLSIDDGAAQRRAAREVIARGLSVRDTEALARRAVEPPKKPAERAVDPNTRAAEERLRFSLGTRVRIVRKGKSGRIEIEFTSEDELQRIYEYLTEKR